MMIPLAFPSFCCEVRQAPPVHPGLCRLGTVWVWVPGPGALSGVSLAPSAGGAPGPWAILFLVPSLPFSRSLALLHGIPISGIK